MSTNTRTIRRAKAGTTEPAWVKWTLISIALGFIFLFLVLPLAAVFTEALRKGFGVFLVEVVVEAVDIGIAPSQTLGRCGFPGAGIWREVGGLCRCFLWGDEGGEGDEGYPSGG